MRQLNAGRQTSSPFARMPCSSETPRNTGCSVSVLRSYLADLVHRGVAPAGDALVLGAELLEEARDVAAREARVEAAVARAHDGDHELPRHAEGAHEGVEVGLADLLRHAVGDEPDERVARGGAVGEGVEAAAAGLRDGLELALRGVVEEVEPRHALDDLLVGEVLVRLELGDDARLSHEELLAGDGAVVWRGGVHVGHSPAF